MEKRIAKNGFYLLLGQVISRAIGFFYFIFLARSLAVEAFGVYAWVLGFIFNFLPVADFGIERYILKNLPRHLDKAEEYFRHLLGLKIILACLTTLLVVSLGFLMGLSGEKLISLLIFSLLFFPQNIFHLIISFQNAREEVLTGVAANIFFSLLGALLGVAAVRRGLGVPWLFVSYLASLVMVVLGLTVRAKKLNLPLKPKFEKKTALLVWRECRFFALLVVMGTFYLRIPLITIGQMMGDYWAGIYGSISKFLEAGVLIPQAISLAVAPTFSRLLLTDKKSLKKIYFKTGTIVVALGLIPLLFFLFGDNFFINLIYGERYLPAASSLKILGFTFPLLFFNYLAANIIENSPEVKKFLPLAVGHFLFVFLSAIVLSAKFGVMGGAASLLSGEILRFFLNQKFVSQILIN
ncbi:oligosaccharide flippase family protein [Candidatus Shapirobacteria bacterium]|nr:oligosaccharide flippase family protein [Candidatus Shapirobacteria bacterium]